MDTFQQDLIKKIGRQNLEKIQLARIGLAGAGGLGSNCAANLVRVGFRKLTIVDFDQVAPANLDRQFYFSDQVGMDKVEALKINLLRINPEIELRLVNEKITKSKVKELFADCDVVAECLDRADYKSMLVEELLALGKFTVAVSGVGGYGSSDEIRVHRISAKFVLIGDLQSDINDNPALSPRVNICAAKQADTVLDYVIHKL